MCCACSVPHPHPASHQQQPLLLLTCPPTVLLTPGAYCCQRLRLALLPLLLLLLRLAVSRLGVLVAVLLLRAEGRAAVWCSRVPC